MEVSNARHQIMSSQLENTMSCQNIQGQQEQQQQLEKKLRPNPEQSLRCPRCDSSNTKFCYYNNYSLSQPRYFCKGCRRYWTQGGSLRNVPVGGGCRKNKRSSNSSKKSQLDHQDIINTNNPLLAAAALPLPPLSYDPNELSLAFATLQHQPMLDCQDSTFLVGNPNPNPVGFLDILRGGFVDNSSSSSGLYYGFGTVGEVEGGGGSGVGGGVMMFPYDAGLMSSTEAVTTTTTATAPTATATAAATRTTTTTSTTSQGSMDGADEDKKLMMGLHHHQWAVGGDHANLGMDPVRDYWNNGVGSSWPGLINSSSLI